MPKSVVEDILVKTVEGDKNVEQVPYKVNIPDNLELLNDQQSNYFYIKFLQRKFK